MNTHGETNDWGLGAISIALIEYETSTLLSAEAALHWLSGTEPKLPEARAALGSIMEDAERRGALLCRLRSLAFPGNYDAVMREGRVGLDD